MKLLNLAWDLLGSDFAGRHMQYEKFYAGPALRDEQLQLSRPGRGTSGQDSVDELLASYDAPAADAEKIAETFRRSRSWRVMRPILGTGQGPGPMPCF